MLYNLVVILGPTATGKTRLGAELAAMFNGEIISADSRQVYRGMDIGTGKDLKDYKVDGITVPHHLVDVVDPGEEFNLFWFVKLFREAYSKIVVRKKVPFLIGGTGLYLHSIIKGYELKDVSFSESREKELREKDADELIGILKELNPGLHNTTDLLETERMVRAIMIAEDEARTVLEAGKGITPLVIGVNTEREIVKKRITARLKERLDEGMIEEVERLVKEGVTFEKLDFFGLEYKYVGQYLKGELNYNDMYQKLRSAIFKFAKRQMTWFRKMEREGVEINWIDGPDTQKAAEIIKQTEFRF